MKKTKSCPYCGADDLILINEELQLYKCDACFSEVKLKKEVETIDVSVEDLSSSKRKMFFDKLMNKTVELHSYFDGDIIVGTGFFISSEYILTNAHIVMRKQNSTDSFELAIQVSGNNYEKNKQFLFDVVAADSSLDIAILKLCEGRNEYVSFSQNIYNGQQVFAIGNSRGEGLCIVEGIISDVSRVIDSNQYFMTSAIVTNGNSGCPVFNENGLLVGMITEGSKLSVAMNYAIPSGILLDYIKRVERNEEITIL